jgi:hypothetical protein
LHFVPLVPATDEINAARKETALKSTQLRDMSYLKYAQKSTAYSKDLGIWYKTHANRNGSPADNDKR